MSGTVGGYTTAGHPLYDPNNPDKDGEIASVMRISDARAQQRDDLNDTLLNALSEISGLRAVCQEASLQIEYLHGKFQETGTGNAVLAKIKEALR